MLRNITGKARERQLQLATGGRYKPYLVEKIVEQLKSNFLQEKKKRLTLKELLTLIEEKNLSDDILVWLAEEALPNHPRLSVVGNSIAGGVLNVKFTYNPPLKISGRAGLLKILKEKYEKSATGNNKQDEVGLLMSVVSDSLPVADRVVQELVQKGQVLEVTRLDRQVVLFYKKPDADLDKCCVDECFVELWRNVDVTHKEMSHIKEYLKNRGLPIFTARGGLVEEDEEKIDDETTEACVDGSTNANPETAGSKKNKRKVMAKSRKRKLTVKRGESKPEPKRKRRQRRSTIFRDNAHVNDDLMHIDIE